MKIHALDSQPARELSAALEQFESQFRYPLGGEAWFRISHGEDYTRFFRAVGTARCFVATSGDEVIGTITSTICQLRRPGGRFQRAAYLADLKVSQSAGGRALLGLLRSATDWTLTQPTPAFCVVMQGTAKSPVSYTGRLGIPEFGKLAELTILRIPSDQAGCGNHDQHPNSIIEVGGDEARKLYVELTPDCYATDGGDASIRCQMRPIGLIDTNGNACGILEDTRRCKRLFRHDGAEMVSAHLSCFGYRSVQDAVALIRAGLERCVQRQIPALFVCVSDDVAGSLVQTLGDQRIVEAPATVFGYALDGPGTWSINTAEI